MRTITQGALIARINRRLAHDRERLRTSRTWTTDTGWHYIVDANRNYMLASHVDVSELARELGLLRPGETVAS